MFTTLNIVTVTNNKAEEFSLEQQELALIGKVLAHPARIAIIELLAQKKEIRTGNISDYLPLGRTTVSQHLKELKEMGIIRGTIDGLKVHYCLDVERLAAMQRRLNDFFGSAQSDFICSCD